METQVLLVDDHPLFRKGIRVLLEGEGDMCIAGEAGDGQAAIDLVRRRMHHLAEYARQRLVDLTGLVPMVPDSPQWYGSMAHVPLPAGDARLLQQQLWDCHGIEVPIIDWGNRRYVRVSCHIYSLAFTNLVHVLTAVDGQGRPGDEAGVVRCEERDQSGDLLRPSQPSDGDLRDYFLKYILAHRQNHLGADIAG